jgi:uncharacterized protein with GYD domain
LPPTGKTGSGQKRPKRAVYFNADKLREEEVYACCLPWANWKSVLKGDAMPSYLIQLSYSAETLAAMIKQPTDRREVVSKLAAQVGGKLVGLWFAFGEYDAIVILEVPDNVSAAACSTAVASSGAFKTFKTTPLLTVEEGLAALKKAGGIDYKPPSRS